MHAATVASITTTADDPHADAGVAFLRAAVWLLATATGYGAAMDRRDYVLAAYWHQARQRAERSYAAACDAFEASRLTEDAE